MRKSEKSYIYEDLLKTNIKKIDLYGLEENRNLIEECDVMKKALENYKSDTNTDLMQGKIEEFEDETIDSLLRKRKKYTNILEKVIVLYHQLTDETVSVFTELGK